MNRKDHHIALAAQQYQPTTPIDLAETRFVHHSLPQLALEDVSLKTSLASLTLSVPFFINAMTGGSEKTGIINQQLAILARETNLAMATGSVSAALSDARVSETFQVVRKEYPQGTIIANLGAGHTVEAAKRAVDLLDADALQLHLNAPQELVMPEGDRDFSRWLENIAAIASQITVPLIVKEVGFGMSRQTAELLYQAGVRILDISGRGGTNFATIEMARRPDTALTSLKEWGQTTAESLLEVREFARDKGVTVMASGGIHTGLAIVKCLGLGAHAVGLSNHILQILQHQSLDDAIAEVNRIQEEVRVVMALLGTRSTRELEDVEMVLAPSLVHWCQQRGIERRKRS